VKRLVIVVTTVALIAGMVGCGQPGPSTVTFADPNLEAAIRETIAIPEGPIYPPALGGALPAFLPLEGISPTSPG
jgi:hypothetical protein